MDNENIYDDLPVFDLECVIDKFKTENNLFKSQINRLESDVIGLTNTVSELRKIPDNLSRNISQLYRTAEAEIDRKNNKISELQTRLDDLLFKRQIHQIIKKDNKGLNHNKRVRDRSNSPSRKSDTKRSRPDSDVQENERRLNYDIRRNHCNNDRKRDDRNHSSNRNKNEDCRWPSDTFRERNERSERSSNYDRYKERDQNKNQRESRPYSDKKATNNNEPPMTCYEIPLDLSLTSDNRAANLRNNIYNRKLSENMAAQLVLVEKCTKVLSAIKKYTSNNQPKTSSKQEITKSTMTSEQQQFQNKYPGKDKDKKQSIICKSKSGNNKYQSIGKVVNKISKETESIIRNLDVEEFLDKFHEGNKIAKTEDTIKDSQSQSKEMDAKRTKDDSEPDVVINGKNYNDINQKEATKEVEDLDGKKPTQSDNIKPNPRKTKCLIRNLDVEQFLKKVWEANKISKTEDTIKDSQSQSKEMDAKTTKDDSEPDVVINIKNYNDINQKEATKEVEDVDGKKPTQSDNIKQKPIKTKRIKRDIDIEQFLKKFHEGNKIAKTEDTIKDSQSQSKEMDAKRTKDDSEPDVVINGKNYNDINQKEATKEVEDLDGKKPTQSDNIKPNPRKTKCLIRNLDVEQFLKKVWEANKISKTEDTIKDSQSQSKEMDAKTTKDDSEPDVVINIKNYNDINQKEATKEVEDVDGKKPTQSDNIKQKPIKTKRIKRDIDIEQFLKKFHEGNKIAKTEDTIKDSQGQSEEMDAKRTKNHSERDVVINGKNYNDINQKEATKKIEDLDGKKPTQSDNIKPNPRKTKCLIRNLDVEQFLKKVWEANKIAKTEDRIKDSQSQSKEMDAKTTKDDSEPDVVINIKNYNDITQKEATKEVEDVDGKKPTQSDNIRTNPPKTKSIKRNIDIEQCLKKLREANKIAKTEDTIKDIPSQSEEMFLEQQELELERKLEILDMDLKITTELIEDHLLKG